MLFFRLEEQLMYEQEFALYEAYSPKILLFPHSAHATFSLVNEDLAKAEGYSSPC